MKKENMQFPGSGKPAGRITRARAAAIRVTGGGLPPKPLSSNPGQNCNRRMNSKRAAADESGHPAPPMASKRRVVLKDVTNISCDISYNKCIDAVKLQTKDVKREKLGVSKPSKETPVVTVEAAKAEDGRKIKVTEEIRKSGVLDSQENRPFFSAEPEENVVIHQSVSSTTNKDNVSTSFAVTLLAKERHFQRHFQSMHQPKKDEDNLCDGSRTEKSKHLNFVDIDSDKRSPQLCSLYAPEIYKNLCVAELSRRPSSDFMEKIQRDITQSMRGILVDWLVEVAEEYKLVPDTLYLTVYFIDRFLSGNYIERQKLQLIGITCMLIASKYEEICAPRVEEFCFITDNTYKREEVLNMESQVLNYLGFQLSAPTTKTFLRRFLRAAQVSNKVPVLALEFLANYLAELTLVEYEFLKFLPSLIAASAVFLARWTLDQSNHPWNLTLEHYTSYKPLDLKHTVFAMQELQINSKGCSLNAIREKYRQEKFKSVAALSSPKLLDTLF